MLVFYGMAKITNSLSRLGCFGMIVFVEVLGKRKTLDAMLKSEILLTEINQNAMFQTAIFIIGKASFRK